MEHAPEVHELPIQLELIHHAHDDFLCIVLREGHGLSGCFDLLGPLKGLTKTSLHLQSASRPPPSPKPPVAGGLRASEPAGVAEDGGIGTQVANKHCECGTGRCGGHERLKRDLSP